MKPFLYAYAYSYCYFVSLPRRDFNWKRIFHFLCYKYTMTAMPGSLGNLAPRWQCWLHGSWCTSEHTQSQETNNQSLTEFHIESSHLINIFGRLCDFDVASITAFPWNRHQFVLFVCLCLFATILLSCSLLHSLTYNNKIKSKLHCFLMHLEKMYTVNDDIAINPAVMSNYLQIVFSTSIQCSKCTQLLTRW